MSLVSLRNVQCKGRNSTSMKILRETEDTLRVFLFCVFVNSSCFQMWYLEKLIFQSIERELHVSTPL